MSEIIQQKDTNQEEHTLSKQLTKEEREEAERKATGEIRWICKKCGLERSNKQTHIHGKSMVK